MRVFWFRVWDLGLRDLATSFIPQKPFSRASKTLKPEAWIATRGQEGADIQACLNPKPQTLNLQACQGVAFVGRLASYKYFNMDQASPQQVAKRRDLSGVI